MYVGDVMLGSRIPPFMYVEARCSQTVELRGNLSDPGYIHTYICTYVRTFVHFGKAYIFIAIPSIEHYRN